MLERLAGVLAVRVTLRDWAREVWASAPPANPEEREVAALFGPVEPSGIERLEAA